MNKILDFYKGKRVFVTGPGYALEPPTNPNLFSIIGVEDQIHSVIGDIRDYDRLREAFQEANPELVFHLAAQPIVLTSYEQPRYTYETNVMGTVNLLECVRQSDSVRSVLNVTTDKVYHNNEWCWGYRENEPLDGFDPYSNSKSCSELVTHSYKSSFFDQKGIAVSTARAGNVIGGGDFADNRIIPDCVRAAMAKQPISVRNPNSTRPYQHVLEPLSVYLTIVALQAQDSALQGYYNVGPNDVDCLTTGELATIFCQSWGEGQTWEAVQKNGPHEANFLKLDCSLVKKTFGWQPVWTARQAVEKTVEWTKVYAAGGDTAEAALNQIREFFSE